ncbi:MAG: hypothetical protein KF760_23785 [Candidatus Eremiobacteraeota bacterium]|nr:hypothetical protein [Candidatus Eremiobacteraeota bacterium]
MIRSRRGNLLLSALFMSAFLFFLSVAIVVTNREDIRSTLLADHKMRAEFAADGILDRDIQLMRSNSDWESVLNNGVSFASGATVQSSVRRLGPTILSLDVQASSNLVRADRHWVLEEFRLADSLATGSLKPHLFAMQGSGWSVLGPNFKWQSLGALSNDVLPHTFSAGGGPVFFQKKEEDSPPTLQDFQPLMNANGTVTNQGFGPITEELPKGNGPYVVELKEDKFTPTPVISPQDPSALGRKKDPTINGEVDGTPTYTTVNINGTQTTVDTSVYQGPVFELYLLTGSVAVGVDKTYYCHAWHIYFRGFKFQNDASGQGSITPPVGPLKEPAILKYEESAKTWTKVVDLLKVPDDQTQPEIIGGPRPDTNYLWVTGSGTIYGKEAGGVNLLTVSGNQFAAGSAIQGDLFTYQDSLVSVTQDGATGVNKLSQSDPSASLPRAVPGRNLGAQPFRSNGMVIELKEEKALDLRYSTKAYPIATAKKDLFALVTCQAVPTGQQAPQSSAQSLAHYDGTSWQFLPNGMAGALPNSSYFLESQRDYGGQTSDMSTTVALALAGYASNQPLLRRYSPRFHY